MSAPLFSRPRIVALFAIAGLLAVACSNDDGTGSTVATTAPAVSEAPTTTATVADTVADTTAATEPATTEPATTDPAAVTPGDWEDITAPADCMCSDASEFHYFVREGDPNRVVLFFEGGGACFSAETCGPGSNTYKRAIFPPPADGDGIFDVDNERNPFLGWSMVYVPYCTGDVHIGNTTTDYGDGVVMQHKGYVNGTAALAGLVDRFPGVEQLVVAGESAGSIPSPLYAGLAHDALPDTRITVLADGSGAYPGTAGLSAGIGALWGTANAIPDWPETEGLTTADWTLPGLFVHAGAHAPEITFARHDYAYDAVQAFFTGLVGGDPEQELATIDGNETMIEGTGVELWSYISPGNSHTVLGKEQFYTESVNGVLLVDWVTALVRGEPVEDVHCVECDG
ncbi:MAG: hypothetical protein KDB17_04980 [Ilumatobacter sp.]|nr:hypothetical protein [Ilumatobacter sp.]